MSKMIDVIVLVVIVDIFVKSPHVTQIRGQEVIDFSTFQFYVEFKKLLCNTIIKLHVFQMADRSF